MIKNASGQIVGAQMISATDGSAFTSAVTVSVTIDGGTQATGSVGSGACTHEGNGYHTYAPAQAETNGDLIAFTFTGSGAVPQTVQIYTRGGDAFTRLGAPAGASVSADVAAIKAETASILTDTGTTLDGKIDTIDGVVDAIKAVTDNLPDSGALTSLATAAALTTVDTVVDAIKVTTDKLDDTLELDSAVYRFTTNALEQAPSGEGGSSDWTDDEKTAIRAILGIPASGTTPDDPSAGILDTIRDAVAVVDGNVDSILDDTGTSGVIVASIAANAVSASALATDAVSEIQSGLATASALTTVDTVVDAIKAVTDNLPDSGALTSLATQASVDAIDNFVDTEIAAILAAVDTEVAAILALLDDARGEPAQGAPPVNPDLATKIDWIYAAWRNKKDNDGSTTNLYADNGTTVIAKQSTSSADGTVTKGEWATGA